jgi:hypothetical protein
MTSGSSSGCLERDAVSEPFELGDEASGVAFGVLALVVVAAEVAVGLAGREHVPVGDEDRVLDGAERAAVPDAGPQALVLGLQEAALGAGRGERGLGEGDREPLGSLAGAPGAAFASGLVVAGTAPGLGREMRGAREAAHVGADLGDHDLGGAFSDAGDRGGERDTDTQMGKIALTQLTSLDGVMQSPGSTDVPFKYRGWTLDFDGGAESDRFKLEQAQNAEAPLLGRVTYETLQAFWPTAEGELADRLNELPKYVVSSTLTDPPWNATVLGDDWPRKWPDCGRSSTARSSSMAAAASRRH